MFDSTAIPWLIAVALVVGIFVPIIRSRSRRMEKKHAPRPFAGLEAAQASVPATRSEFMSFSSTPPPSRPTEDELQRRLAEASTFDDIVSVYYDAPNESSVESAAAEKIVALFTAQYEAATSVDDCAELYKAISEAGFEWEELDALRDKALLKAVSFITTRQEAHDFFVEMSDLGVEDGNEAYPRVLAIAIEKSSTCGDCVELYQDLHANYNGCEDEEQLLLKRAYDLASSADECNELLGELDDDDDLRADVMIKQIGYFDSVEECQGIWDEEGVDGPVGEAAICRAADIIRQRESATAPTDEGVVA